MRSFCSLSASASTGSQGNRCACIADLRLCRCLGLSPGYWLRAQAAHDTQVASAELAEEIERIEPLVGSTAAASLDGRA
jgi:hypothetical protein